MKFLKKLLLFIITTTAAVYLIIWSLDAFGFHSPIFAFLVNWLAMSWVAIAGHSINFSFPSRYYDIKAFELTGKIYENLGIRLFKRLVRRGPLSIFSSTLRFQKDRTLSVLQYLDIEMRKAETGHMFIFLIMLLIVSYALLSGRLDAAIWILGFNVIINGYPIMLQRYNRIKIQKLIQRKNV